MQLESANDAVSPPSIEDDAIGAWHVTWLYSPLDFRYTSGITFCRAIDDEEKIQQDLKVTVRCIPNDDRFAEEGTCPFTGKPSSKRIVFAKSY